MDNKPEKFEDREPSDAGRQWSGFAEIDQAIAEDRLTGYRLQKSWRDPTSRKLLVFCAVAIAGVFAYLVTTSLL